MSDPKGTDYQILTTGAETGGAFGLVAYSLPPFSTGTGLHRHGAHTEGCVVVAGLVALTHGDETLTLTAGQVQLLPPGCEHTCWNPGPTPAMLLLIYSPGGDAGQLLRLAQGEGT